MNKYDIGYSEIIRERLDESGLNCKEAIYFFGALVGVLAVILLVLPS